MPIAGYRARIGLRRARRRGALLAEAVWRVRAAALGVVGEVCECRCRFAGQLFSCRGCQPMLPLLVRLPVRLPPRSIAVYAPLPELPLL